MITARRIGEVWRLKLSLRWQRINQRYAFRYKLLYADAESVYKNRILILKSSASKQVCALSDWVTQTEPQPRVPSCSSATGLSAYPSKKGE